MSFIDSLDIEELKDFSVFSVSPGKGFKMENALTEYKTRLDSLSTCFSDKDTSTAHGVIDAVSFQTGEMLTIINEINLQVDKLIEAFETDIIQEEDRIAASLSEE